MYLNQQEIQELIHYRSLENPVVSLYLNVTPRKFQTELHSLTHVAKNKVRERKTHTEGQIEGVEEVLRQIASHVEKSDSRFKGILVQ